MGEKSNENFNLFKIESMANSIAMNEGCKLYDIEFVGTGSGKTLRIFIDKEGGVSLDDCSNVSKALSSQLDADDLISTSYSLEVSSPGLERKLRLPWHYQANLGKKAQLKLKNSLSQMGVFSDVINVQNQDKSKVVKKWLSSKLIKCELSSLEGEHLTISLEPELSVVIPFHEIIKANLIYEIETQAKNKR